MKGDTVKAIKENAEFLEIDFHFAEIMGRMSGKGGHEVMLAAALASRSIREGNVCLDLASFAGKEVVSGLVAPRLGSWTKKLEGSGVVGRPGDYRPMILDGRGSLYFYRWWKYESDLASFVRERADRNANEIDEKRLGEGLGRLFGPKGEGTDWQKVAAFAAATKSFCVISGGPGTGKTWAVAKILALLAWQSPGRKLRAALAAPTGKAAARMQEAVKEAKERIDCEESLKDAIPGEASTIHRLLGYVPSSPWFRHDEKNPLPVDVVVVDESSMADIALMSKLARAIPAGARLILLGDKDQLASVEAGAVLGDICNTGKFDAAVFSSGFAGRYTRVAGEGLDAAPARRGVPAIADCIVSLVKNWRFGEKSGIGLVGAAVRDGDGARAKALLWEGGFDDVRWFPLPPKGALERALKERIVEGFAPYIRAGSHEEKLDLLGNLRILCAVKEGPYGVHALNEAAQRVLAQEGMIRPAGRWYENMPILVTRNDYTLRLFNGDVGIILPDPGAGGDLRAFFKAPGGEIRKIPPLRLPDHETVYAMTVHKSQGSEFERVLVFLPDRDSPILTRELLYTAVTRARRQVEIACTDEIFLAAASRPIERASGLRAALWGEAK